MVRQQARSAIGCQTLGSSNIRSGAGSNIEWKRTATSDKSISAGQVISFA